METKITIITVGMSKTGKTTVFNTVINNLDRLAAENNIRLFNPSENSRFVTSCRFSAVINRRGVLPDLEFTDIPGEMFSDPDSIDRLDLLFNEASVLIIPIDSPSLMENGGKDFEKIHKPDIIRSKICGSGFLSDRKQKLVLTVPLKWEKYFAENRMDELEKNTEKGFGEYDVRQYGLGELFRTFGECGNVTAAVTPILTEGESKFCEQPALYILSWIIRLVTFEEPLPEDMELSSLGGLAAAALNNSTIFRSLHKSSPSKDLYSNNLYVKLKRKNDGYKIIRNPMGI